MRVLKRYEWVGSQKCPSPHNNLRAQVEAPRRFLPRCYAAGSAVDITLALMKIRSFLSRRAAGAAGVLGLFALQSVYAALFCSGGIFGFLEVTAFLAIPAALLLVVFGSSPALAACAVLLPFILLANAAECAPYQGGGAAMGYVPAFLFGMPLALIAGLGVAGAAFLKRRRAHEG